MPYLSSPRRRRRLAWVAGVLAVCAVVAVVATLIPNTNGYQASKFSNEPVQRVQVERQVPVTRARRAQINALFDRFVPAGIERRDPAAAYDLMTPAGRAGGSRADWRRGQLPIFEYRARGSRFHGWTVQGSYRDSMDLDLYLQPASAKDGPVDYAVELRRIHGRWLIDSIYPRSTYAPTAPVTRGKTSTAPEPVSTVPQARTGVAWILIAALLVMILAAPTVFFASQWLSGRRHRSRFADETR